MADLKLLAARVYNKTKSCVLMRQYRSGMWAFPTISIPVVDDPVLHIDNLVSKHLDGDFELVAAVNIFEFTRLDDAENKSFNYVYDILYEGYIYPAPPEELKRYKSGRWMMNEAIKREKDLTFLMREFISLMEKRKNV